MKTITLLISLFFCSCNFKERPQQAIRVWWELTEIVTEARDNKPIKFEIWVADGYISKQLPYDGTHKIGDRELWPIDR